LTSSIVLFSSYKRCIYFILRPGQYYNKSEVTWYFFNFDQALKTKEYDMDDSNFVSMGIVFAGIIIMPVIIIRIAKLMKVIKDKKAAAAAAAEK